MPPKSKENLKSVCAQCVNCHCVVATKWKLKHMNECSKDSPFRNSWISERDEPAEYGFIKKSTLHAVTKSIAGDDLAVPKQMKSSIALLHPSTMYLCGMTVASPVVVDQDLVLFAWPEKSLLVGEIGLLGQDSKLKSKVTVYALQGEHIEAEKMDIVIGSPQNFTSKDEFSTFVRNHLLGQFLTSGRWISVSYLGCPCQINVKTVVGVNRAVSETELIDLSCVDNVAEGLQDLSLCGSGDSSNASLCFSPGAKSLDDSFLGANFSTPLKGKSSATDSVRKFFQITERTEIKILTSEDAGKSKAELGVSFDDIGGLENEKNYIKDMIRRPLTDPGSYERLGLSPPRGVLVFGPSGVGKSLFARAVCRELTSICHVIQVNGPEIWSKFYGETEAQLRKIFQEAVDKAPSLVFIDELDSLCTKRENVNSEAERRVVATLLTLMDGLETSQKGHVVVLGTTSKPDNLDPAVRRPGRFDREMEISIPSAQQRIEILLVLLRKVKHNLTEDDIKDISNNCHGYSGADMSALCREAGFHAVKSCVAMVTEESVAMAPVARADFKFAQGVVKPSTMREVSVDVPEVLWSDIGGQDELKLKLKQSVVWPLKHPEAFTRLGIKPPKGVLMYGPPGCSKTMIAKAVATESGLNFIAIKGPELFNKWVGESERAVREVFRKARKAAPAVVFFDELDALAVKRGASGGSSNVGERVLAQLLTELDGVESLCDVTVMAATNRPDMIDSALLRPGRIDRIIYVPLPDQKTRSEIFTIKLAKMSTKSVNIDVLTSRTEGYSGAEVAAVCHEAALRALERDLTAHFVEMIDFEHALNVVKPRTTQAMLKLYHDYQNR